jgi:hypothetical protein
MIAERYLAKRFRHEVLDMLDEDTRKEVECKLRHNPNPSPEDG